MHRDFKFGTRFHRTYDYNSLRYNWAFWAMEFLFRSLSRDKLIRQRPIVVELCDFWALQGLAHEMDGLPGDPWNPHWAVRLNLASNHDLGPEIYWSYGFDNEGSPCEPRWPVGTTPTFDNLRKADAKVIYYGNWDWMDGLDPSVGTAMFKVREHNMLDRVVELVIRHIKSRVLTLDYFNKV